MRVTKRKLPRSLRKSASSPDPVPATTTGSAGRPSARTALAGLLLFLCLGSAAALPDSSIDQQLARADAVKRSNFAEFTAALDGIASRGDALSQAQREHLAYLRAWQATFSGDYNEAIDALHGLVARASDPVIRFRSRSTLTNALTLARRHAESFEQLITLLEELPTQTDPDARAQALGVAAQLHYRVGQHADSQRYSAQLLKEGGPVWARCGAVTLQYDSRFRSGDLGGLEPLLEEAITTCVATDEQVFVGVLRVIAARLHLAKGRPRQAIDTLAPFADQVNATNYGHLIAETAVWLAAAHLELGELAAAERRAAEAIEASKDGESAEPLAEAWRIRAELANRRGDPATAFAALQRHGQIERAILNDLGQRALAFELARFRAQAQKLEIDGLSQQNQLLQLQQQVSDSAVANARLWILLLLSVLGFAVLLGLRSRRLQHHFQRQTQRDSLTGAASRPHFMSEARSLLAQAERSGQNVSLVIMDLDYFKRVNDEHGHAVGDEMLRRAAARCIEGPARHGLFGRLGGEEFAFLLPGLDAPAAIELMEPCRRAINTIDYGPRDATAKLSASFGVADSAVFGHGVTDLLMAADAALYEAKRKGRNRVVYLGVHPARHGSEAQAEAGGLQQA